MENSPARLLRSLHARVKLRGWIALAVLVAAALALPQVLRSRFVAQRRAALALRRAEAHLASREFELARADFHAALRLQPDDAAARRGLAQMELALGNTELASLEYESLTEMHPEDAEAWTRLAELMVKGGQLEAPEAVLDRAVEVDAQRPEARLLRGDIRFRLGRYYGALEDGRAAVAGTPSDIPSWTLLVRSAARSQGTASGLETARKALATLGDAPAARLADVVTRDPGPLPAPPRRLRPDAQTGRGNLGAWTREHWPGRLAGIRQSLEEQLQRRDWNEAQRTVDSAAHDYPGSAFAPFLGGILALTRGNLEEAEKRLSEALALAPRLPAIIAALGRTWSLKGGPGFAGEQLMRLATRDPGLPIARYMAARAYIEARDPLRAEASLRRGLELQPDAPAPYQHLTDYYFGLDRAAEALEICRQGLDRFPEDVDLQMMLAQMEAGIGQRPEAIRVYEGLLAKRPDLDLAQYKLATLLAAEPGEDARQRFLAGMDRLRGDMPSDPLLLDALGWLQYRAQDARRARVSLEAAVKGAPEEPSLHYHLAMVYAQAHEMTLAQQELKTALDSPRPFAERIDALRLFRQNDSAPTPKGKLSITSQRH